MSIGDSVVIFAGAGGIGCGRSIAMRFASDVIAVIVSDINASGGLETVRNIADNGARAAFFRADIR